MCVFLWGVLGLSVGFGYRLVILCDLCLIGSSLDLVVVLIELLAFSWCLLVFDDWLCIL